MAGYQTCIMSCVGRGGFYKKSVDEQGRVNNAYTGWAVTAEEGKTDLIDKKLRGFVPEILMLAADEMTRYPGQRFDTYASGANTNQ